MAPAKMAIDGKSTSSSGKGTEEGEGRVALGAEESERTLTGKLRSHSGL